MYPPKRGQFFSVFVFLRKRQNLPHKEVLEWCILHQNGIHQYMFFTFVFAAKSKNSCPALFYTLGMSRIAQTRQDKTRHDKSFSRTRTSDFHCMGVAAHAPLCIFRFSRNFFFIPVFYFAICDVQDSELYAW